MRLGSRLAVSYLFFHQDFGNRRIIGNAEFHLVKVRLLLSAAGLSLAESSNINGRLNLEYASIEDNFAVSLFAQTSHNP